MKELLERWSQLEPHLCKRETRPNKDWHEEFEDYYIAIQTDDSEGWQLVYSDRESRGYFPSKNESLARIQWAIQQAIIEKGWFFRIQNWHNADGYYIRVDIKDEHKFLGQTYSSITEGLLTAYLKVLEAHATTEKP